MSLRQTSGVHRASSCITDVFPICVCVCVCQHARRHGGTAVMASGASASSGGRSPRASSPIAALHRRAIRAIRRQICLLHLRRPHLDAPPPTASLPPWPSHLLTLVPVDLHRSVSSLLHFDLKYLNEIFYQKYISSLTDSSLVFFFDETPSFNHDTSK